VPVVCTGECAELFKRLYLSGARFSEIEARTGVPADFVSIYARAMGLPARRGPSQWRKVGDAELEKLRQACAEGCTSGEAAKVLGVSMTTARVYLAALGLYVRSHGGRGRRCPEIPEGVLVEAVEKRTPDHIVAMRLGTTKWCVQWARLRRGLLKNRPVRGKTRLERDLKTVLEVLEEEGFTTSKALRGMGVAVNKELLEVLRQMGAESFRLKYCATASYTVIPLRLCGQRIIYLRGREGDVVAFLAKASIAPPKSARRAMRAVLRKNGAPPELVEAV